MSIEELKKENFNKLVNVIKILSTDMILECDKIIHDELTSRKDS